MPLLRAAWPQAPAATGLISGTTQGLHRGVKVRAWVVQQQQQHTPPRGGAGYKEEPRVARNPYISRLPPGVGWWSAKPVAFGLAALGQARGPVLICRRASRRLAWPAWLGQGGGGPAFGPNIPLSVCPRGPGWRVNVNPVSFSAPSSLQKSEPVPAPGTRARLLSFVF